LRRNTTQDIIQSLEMKQGVKLHELSS